MSLGQSKENDVGPTKSQIYVGQAQRPKMGSEELGLHLRSGKTEQRVWEEKVGNGPALMCKATGTFAELEKGAPFGLDMGSCAGFQLPPTHPPTPGGPGRGSNL